MLALVWLVAAFGGGLGLRELSARMARIPRPISTREADAIWYWIGQVGPEEGVLAAYEVTAPLSSRAALQLYPRAEQARGFPRARPRVPVDLSPRQGSRSQGLSRPGLRRRS